MISITPLNNPTGSTQQEYNSAQEALIPVVNSTSEFNPTTDKIIFSIEDINKNLLSSNKVSNFGIRNYENTFNENQISSVVVYPVKDIEDNGYDVGIYNVYYNFYRPALKSDQYKFFLQEISPSRTEIRLSVNNVPNEEIDLLIQEFQTQLEGINFKDFYIEINNSYYIANNILTDTTSVPHTILIKLYQPLPSGVVTNTQLQVVFETAETVGFNINLPPSPIQIEGDIEYIKGPNYNLHLSDQVNNSTIEEDYNSLVNSNQLTSSYNELQNVLNQKGITVNIDYTNFENFIQFSSAEQRLRNFYYKVGEIEEYNNNISLIDNITGNTLLTPPPSSSKSFYENQITNIIKNFDGYENYLYYTSGALAYPKLNTTPPYTLQSTGSNEVLNWLGSVNEESSYYGGILLSASLYDNENQDNLWNTIPTYLKEDPANAGYELFLNMIGQHFDILYSYINTITDKYNTDNRLDYGVSKNLVADVLRDAGLKLYQNNFSSDNIYNAILGFNPDGTTLPYTGSEYIDTYVGLIDSATPVENINKETYKRLYHNLPYLLKKKGTVEGLRALINCFGIPDTILRISEFGGKDKDNTNDWDYTYNRFSYALNANATDQVVVPWTSSLFGSPVPDSIFFRFKTNGLRNFEDQCLLLKDSGSFFSASSDNPDFYLELTHTGSGALSSGSYSGSIASQSADYGTLTLYMGDINYERFSCSINLPFYNDDWWSVGVIKSSTSQWDLYAGQKIYNGNDGWKIGYIASSSISDQGSGIPSASEWNDVGMIRLGNDQPISGSNITSSLFYGYYQELRFYNTPLTDSIFKDFTMNPTSLESLSLQGSNSTFNTLSFRAALGNELRDNNNPYISPVIFITGSALPTNLPFNLPLLYNVMSGGGLPVSLPFLLPLLGDIPTDVFSIHPAVTASAASLISQSFGTNSLYKIKSYNDGYPLGSHLVENVESYYFDQPAVGIKNRISEKVRIGNPSLPLGNTLSPYKSIQQDYPSERNYTQDINYVEVAFSPQNEINDDINSTFGYFNIGDYIGDPRQLSESANSYPELDSLRDSYFEKYYKSYDWKDYIRLIKYFDNSLFKMVQDFVPASSGLASGVVIKQHLLERNKQRPAQVEFSQHDYSGSITTAFISGTSAGVYNDLTDVSPQITQSWSYLVDTPVGQLPITQSTQDEFYNGELSGSTYVATTGELNDENISKFPSTLEINYTPYMYVSNTSSVDYFTNNVIPNQGEIYLWYDTGSVLDTGEEAPSPSNPGGSVV